MSKTINLVTGFDHGFRLAKNPNKTKFLSTVKLDSNVTQFDKEIYSVKYKGKEYTVGAENGTSNIAIDKVSSEQDRLYTKIITMVGLSQQISDNVRNDLKNKAVINAKLIVGAPTSLHKQQSLDIIEALKEIESETIIIQDKTYVFTIEDVKVYHQFIGTVWDKFNDFKDNEITAVYDLGGEHLNIAVFVGKKIQDKKSYSRAGYNYLAPKLITKMEEISKRTLDIENLDSYLSVGEFKDIYDNTLNFDHPELKQIIIEHMNLYFDVKARNEISLLRDAHTHILSGGTGLRFHKQIKEATGVDFELSNEPLFGNAIAFKEIAERHFVDEI